MIFFGKQAFGLDISDRTIEAVAIRKKLKTETITASSRIMLAPGSIEDGEIKQPDKLAQALRKLLNDADFDTDQAVLALPESKTFIHVFTLPAVISEKNIGTAVQYAAEETIPISFEHAYHDYQILTKDEKRQDVLYCATFAETVKQYQDVLQQIGITPAVIEPESLALARALIWRTDSKDGSLIIDIGSRTTIITVYDHRGIRYSENIAAAGNAFTEALASSHHVTTEEAERLKRETGIAQADSKQADSSIIAVADRIIAAVHQARMYYQSHTGYTLSQAVVCGGTSMMPGLVNYLGAKLNIKTFLGNPLAGLEYDSQQFPPEQRALYGTAIGLALRGRNKQGLENGINVLRYDSDHSAYSARTKENQINERPAAGLKNRFKLSMPTQSIGPDKKRLFWLGGVFLFLTIVFIVLLIIQSGREEPLIKIIETTPDYPVNQQAPSISP